MPTHLGREDDWFWADKHMPMQDTSHTPSTMCEARYGFTMVPFLKTRPWYLRWLTPLLWPGRDWQGYAEELERALTHEIKHGLKRLHEVDAMSSYMGEMGVKYARMAAGMAEMLDHQRRVYDTNTNEAAPWKVYLNNGGD